MEKENIKLSFIKVKEDMIFLSNEVSSLKTEIEEIKSLIIALHNEIIEIKNSKIPEFKHISPLNATPTDNPIHIPTNQQIIKTSISNPTDRQTVPQEIGGLKDPNSQFSTGNEGVPTDRQTYQPTDQQTPFNKEIGIPNRDFNSSNENIEVNIKKASEILDSLDKLKKDIRQKFKKLTSQEMTVFSCIYQLSEQNPNNTTYRMIAENLKLSESSIRDYVLKIISKGIPLKKEKIDNKKVVLSVSNDLKKIATLSTIIQLREL